MNRTTVLFALAVGTLLVGVWSAIFILRSPPDLGIELLSNGNVHHVDREGPAAAAGLQVGDLVRRIDGRPIHGGLFLYEGKSPGSTVELEVVRGGQPVRIQATLGAVTGREYIFRIERLGVGFIFWMSGLVVWLLRPALPSARLFLVFSQVTAGMLFAEVLDPSVPAMAFLTDLLRYLVAPLALHLFATFPSPLAAPLRLALLRTVYGCYIAVALLLVSSVIFTWDLYATGLWMAPRIFEVIVLVLALGVLLRPQPGLSLDAQRRRRMLLTGIVLGITPMLATLATLMWRPGGLFVPYEWTLPALALMPMVYGYAVYREELDRADFILNRSMVYLLLTASLLGAYALLFFGIDALFSSERGWEHVLAGVLLVVAGSSLFVPLRTRLQHVVDHLFYGGWYDYRTFVQSVSADLSRSTSLESLVRQLQTAAETMRFEGGTLLWRRGNVFYPLGSFGFDRSQLLHFKMPTTSRLPQLLQEKEMPLPHEELCEALAGADLTRKERELLDAQGITFWIPLVCRGTLHGILVTGRRQGEEELDREDRAILATLSTQAAFACENIALLESLKERLTEVERVRDELAEAQARLTEGREDERLHLARELHDGPVQDLYATVHELELLAGENGTGDLADRINPLRETMQRVAGTLRDVCIELRPPLLADFGLGVTIRSYVARFREKHPDVDVSVDLMPLSQELPERVQLALFRICQEALNNAVQHGKARHVRIRFEADAERILLEIADDGAGFVVPKRWIEFGRKGHLGLLGIAERAEAIEGALDVVSSPGAGTTLRVTAPWPGTTPAHPPISQSASTP